MSKTITISLSGIAITAAAFFIGLLVGKTMIEEPKSEKTVEIAYVKGETIHDTIEVPQTVKVKETPEKPKFEPSDSTSNSKVWDDYFLDRTYTLDFSNDTIGVFKVDALVSQNKLVRATSTIQPLTKTVKEKETIYKVAPLSVWGILGTSPDFRTNKIQMGVTIKQKFIIGASGIRFDDKYNYTIDVGINF